MQSFVKMDWIYFNEFLNEEGRAEKGPGQDVIEDEAQIKFRSCAAKCRYFETILGILLIE